MTATKKRRTQQERREETIGKLIEATIQSLLEKGYRATTVQEICSRSGVSHGGLFRHFKSVLELVLAASEDVGRRQIANFEARFAAVPDRSMATALRLLREACRSPENTVFYELLVAARTNEELRTALAPQARRYYQAIRDAARRLPGMDEVPPEVLGALVFGIVHLFDGESLTRVVVPEEAEEELRMAFLERIVDTLKT